MLNIRFNVIVAMTSRGGIGLDGKLPWNLPEELKSFNDLTNDSVLIMGRKTVESLPKIKNKQIVCVTSKKIVTSNNCMLTNSFLKALQLAKMTKKEIFVAGGVKIYEEALQYGKLIKKFYVSIVNEDYKYDRFVDFDRSCWMINKVQKFNTFTLYSLIYSKDGEYNYLNMLKNVFTKGIMRISRSGPVLSKFNKTITFKNVNERFPLLTTKKCFFRGIVEEFLFFIRGETNSKILEEKKINIWKGNTSKEFLKSVNLPYEEGEMGPMYGYQWRFFNKPFFTKAIPPEDKLQGNNGYDQLKYVVDTIKNDPHSRRIMMTTFNPAQVNQGVLYPCHSIVTQFYVDDDCLDVCCYNRSSDLFLGLPFNIASTSLLLLVVANLTQKIPRDVHITLGDAHIYKTHEIAVTEQLRRFPYKLPFLYITKQLDDLKDLDDLAFEDFQLENYLRWPAIKAKMSV